MLQQGEEQLQEQEGSKRRRAAAGGADLRRVRVPRRVCQDDAIAARRPQRRQLGPARHIREEEGALRREPPARLQRLDGALVLRVAVVHQRTVQQGRPQQSRCVDAAHPRPRVPLCPHELGEWRQCGLGCGLGGRAVL